MRFAVLPECRSCPCFFSGVFSLVPTKEVLAEYPHQTVIQFWNRHLFHRDRSVSEFWKTKKPITQSITNQREHRSRFKMMFYVIGFEIQRRVLLHTAPANRTKGVVEQFGTFRSTESVSGRPDISQYGRTFIFSCYVCVDIFSTSLLYKK